jgi:hypothetical protein
MIPTFFSTLNSQREVSQVSVTQGGSGNGTDHIDDDGKGRLVFVDSNGKPTMSSVTAYSVPGQPNTWRAYLPIGEQITFTRNSPLTIQLPDGSTTVIDNFVDGEVGIHLKDIPQDPDKRVVWRPQPQSSTRNGILR